MALTNKDKNFLIKSLEQSKKILKLFGKTIQKQDVDFLLAIEPAIKNDNLSEEQLKFLIKNMQNVYYSTRKKYVKQLIGTLEEMLDKKSNELVVNLDEK